MLGAILGTGGYGTEQNRQISSYTELAFSNCNELVHIREVSPGGTAVKDLPVNPGDTSLSPGSGRSPGGGNGNPLQYSHPRQYCFLFFFCLTLLFSNRWLPVDYICLRHVS